MANPTTWNFESLFASDTDPNIGQNLAAATAATQAFITTWESRSDYLTQPEILAEALQDYTAWATKHGISGNAGYYFSLRLAQDQSNTMLKARENLIDDQAIKSLNAIQFFTLRVAKISPLLHHDFLTHPSLTPYKHFLEQLFANAKYHLSEPEERVLNLKSGPSHSNWTHMVQEFVSGETRDGQSFSEIQSHLLSQDKATRDQAAVHINDILAKHVDVAEHELNSILQNKKFDDELRKLPRPDATRHISDDISSQIVDTLLSAVESKFTLAHRFYALKAKLLGLPKLAYHERVVEYGKIDKPYPYEAATTLVSSVFTTLDPQFGQIFDSFTAQGQIDVYPHAGKRGGAFCTHDMLTNPTYILLNHTDKLNDVLTLAHEAGHGINNELMRLKQNALNFDTPLSTAEVASTFMEDFVLQRLMTEADADLRLALMVKKLDDDISTIIRQVACYRFEQELHTLYRTTGYLSKVQIGDLFSKHMSSYMGTAVEQSPRSQNWWVYWTHIRSFFYVYSYASGLLISKSLQASVAQDPTFISKVKDFLSAGSSDSPQNIFAKVGVDITQADFWTKGLSQIETLLTQT